MVELFILSLFFFKHFNCYYYSNKNVFISTISNLFMAKYRLKPIITKVVNILRREGFEIERWNGDHIIINKTPSLRRPIVLVNVKTPSNAVRQNLISSCREAGVSEGLINELNDMLRY